MERPQFLKGAGMSLGVGGVARRWQFVWLSILSKSSDAKYNSSYHRLMMGGRGIGILFGFSIVAK